MATTTRNGKHQATGQWIRTDKRLAIYLRDRFSDPVEGGTFEFALILTADKIRHAIAS